MNSEAPMPVTTPCTNVSRLKTVRDLTKAFGLDESIRTNLPSEKSRRERKIDDLQRKEKQAIVSGFLPTSVCNPLPSSEDSVSTARRDEEFLAGMY